MLRVMIVDDEELIRQWFVFCIENAQKDYHVVGEASNGKEAYEIFLKEFPDIVITDISMPIMDGIELLKKIKQLNQDTDVILLTCHSDFEYARQALKLGAFEYVLKSEVNKKDIISILERLGAFRKDKYIKQSNIDTQLKRDCFIKALINKNEIDTSQIQLTAESLGICLKDKNLLVLALDFSKGEEFFTENNYLKLGQIQNYYNICCFKYSNDILLLIGNLSQTPSRNQQLNFLHNIASYIQRTLGVSLGASKIYDGFSNLKTAVHEAVMSLSQQFFKGNGSITYYTEIENRLNDHQPFAEMVLYKAFFEALENNNTGNVMKTFFEIFDNFKRYYFDVEKIFQICAKILNSLEARILKVGKSIDNSAYEIAEFKHLPELEKYIQGQVMEALRKLNEQNNVYSSPVSQVLEYIENNYNRHIALSDVATYVHLNPDYIGRIFKEETGETFSRYLISYRMGKAEKLLKNENIKIYEVAHMVGYPNFSYFSRAFKEFKGYNAFELRKDRNHNMDGHRS